MIRLARERYEGRMTLVARKLGIGVGTVKTHVKGVMSKLDATARTHAVVVATQRGLIRPGGGVHPAAFS